MNRLISACTGLLAAAAVVAPLQAQQGEDRAKERAAGFELYGFVMADAIYDHSGINPDWGDAARPSRLPSYADQYGQKGNFFFGVKQSRIGIKPHVPTALGEITAQFDIDMFGVGVDAGQTTIRLRHAYAQLGQFGFGQTESAFMDLDVFPNAVDYWGPNGMVFFRNVQFRWLPVRGRNELVFALERPGASPDAGAYADRVELQDVRVRFPVPDLSAHYKFRGEKWGHVQLAGILRYTKWDDLGNEQFDLSGDALGWGVNASTNLNLGSKAVFRGQVVYGEGIQNYMNDAPVDIGLQNQFDNTTSPVKGVPLPMWSFSTFVDLNWSPKATSTLGYSMLQVDNSDGQAPDAFKRGQYAAANVLFYPVPNLFVGPEVQYIWRTNFADNFDTGGFRVQVSAKYSFSANFGGK
jgi:DcaP outer membrane protein